MTIIYMCVQTFRFYVSSLQKKLCFVDNRQLISDYIKKTFDECSAHVVRHVFEICRINSLLNSDLKPVASFEALLSSLSTFSCLNRDSLMEYISILSDNQDPYLLSDGNSVNPKYSLDVPKLLRKICQENIFWFIGERYGKHAKRIYRLLLDKPYMEQKHISDFSMVPFKETKAILYQLYLDSIVDCKQIIRTPDANPLSSIFLFSANFGLSVSIILEYAKAFAGKIIDRRISLNDKIKTLLQKNIKICSEFDMENVPITSTMRCILSNDKKIQYLSESEKSQLSSFHGSISQYIFNLYLRLDFSEINIAQVILVLDTFQKVST
ncbi:hypothetical protein MXB_4967 [Myxobolus squamalis]|nr:hypothetical protein MXB_4967 [Myxobolus squamalis]